MMGEVCNGARGVMAQVNTKGLKAAQDKGEVEHKQDEERSEDKEGLKDKDQGCKVDNRENERADN